MTTITRPATHDEVNGTHDPAYVYELRAGKGLVVHVPDEIPTSGERLGDLDLDLIAYLMRTVHDVEAYPGQMGGNCGAICYGGDVEVEEDGHTFETPKWLAGPGTYRTSLGHSTGSLLEFGTSMDTYVADTDDVGVIEVAATGATTHSQIAALLATVAAFGTWDGPLSNDRVEALGLDGSLRSTPQWLIEEQGNIHLQIIRANIANKAKREQATAARSYVPEGY